MENEEEIIIAEKKKSFFSWLHLQNGFIQILLFVGAFLIGYFFINYSDQLFPSTVTVSPTPTVTLSPTDTPYPTTAPITPTNSPTPTPRPADPIIDGVNRQYRDKQVGLEFIYPKEWELRQTITAVSDGNIKYLETYTSLGSINHTFSIIHNPYEYYIPGNMVYEEPIMIDGDEQILRVTLDCGLGMGNDCPKSITLENKNYITASISVSIKNGDYDLWIIQGPRWTPDKAVTLDILKKEFKDFASRIKFLE